MLHRTNLQRRKIFGDDRVVVSYFEESMKMIKNERKREQLNTARHGNAQPPETELKRSNYLKNVILVKITFSIFPLQFTTTLSALLRSRNCRY